MRRFELAAALLVFLGIALAIYAGRPEPPDMSLFGEEIALQAGLPALTAPGGTLELRGQVRRSDGSPAADAFLVLLRPDDDPSEAEPVYRSYSDAGGCFAFTKLTPGPYTAVITHPSTPPRTLAIELPVEGEVSWVLAEPLPPLPVLPPLRRTHLAGRLVLPELAAEAHVALEGFEVALVPAAETVLLAGACERRATTDAEGRFELDELVVASYRIEVFPPWAIGGSWPVLGRGTCTLVDGAENKLELGLDVGALEGELREPGGRPLVGALVKISALDARDAVNEPQAWPVVVTDAAGHFQLELLPPGRYLVHQHAGSAVRDVEVFVERGKRTLVPVGELDPRAGPRPADG
jgi:hypothetical protein